MKVRSRVGRKLETEFITFQMVKGTKASSRMISQMEGGLDIGLMVGGTKVTTRMT